MHATMLTFFALLNLLLLHHIRAVNLPDPDQPPDHQAHSKPGGPYYAVDWDDDGMEPLTIDATQSHTHYFDHGPPPSSGTIVKYEWYSMTTGKKLLATDQPYMAARFYLGTTILKLVVTDSTGDKADGFTYVKVRQPLLGENKTPTVERVEPNTAPMSGGAVVTIYGTAFYNNVYVYFAGQMIKPEVLSNKELRLRVPQVKKPGNVSVYVSTAFGTSAQEVAFQYDKSVGNPVKFSAKFVQDSDGEPFQVPDVTALKLGPDGQYYAGTLDGYVRVLRIDRTLTVRSSCTSKSVGAGRSVLGIAFHPNEHRPPAVYLSTSTLEWDTKQTGDDWDNGKIEVWSQQGDADCLSYGRTLVSGLPVSKGDHGVNGLIFKSDGTLLVAVGGSTNAGVHTDGDNLGGVPESPLSAAILSVKTFNESFQGQIKYDGRADPGTATIASGSVEVFASGLRNVFGITLHSNGEVYAMDNGPNNGKGFGATGCNTIGRQEDFKDKLVHVKKGGYYGHPNWNRGRFDKRQCTFVRGDSSGQPGYSTPLALLESSTNGIVEYTANTFGSQMRGYLIFSKMSWELNGVMMVAKLSKSGTSLDVDPYEIYDDSGLVVEMGPYGELLMPKVKQAKILGLFPNEPVHGPLHIIAVTPRRGPALGDNTVLVTGSGLTEGVKIFFGKEECTAYGEVADDGSYVKCIVPPYLSGQRTVSVIARTPGFESTPSGQGEYEYMKL